MKKVVLLFLTMMLITSLVMTQVCVAKTLEIVGDTISIKYGAAKVKVAQDATTTRQLIVAGYQGNDLLKTVLTTIPAGEGETVVSVPQFDENTTTTKFFLWDNLLTMNPVQSFESRNLTSHSLTISSAEIESGGYGGGKKLVNNTRLRVNRLIPVTKGSVLSYNLNGMCLYVDWVKALDATRENGSGWLTGTGAYTVTEDGYLGVTLAASNKTDVLAPEDYVADLSVAFHATDMTITSADIEIGGWGNGKELENDTRLRVNRLIPVTAGTVVSYELAGQKIFIDEYEGTTALRRSGWLTGNGSYTVVSDCSIGIFFADGTNTNNSITVADYDSKVSIKEPTGIAMVTAKDLEKDGWQYGKKLVNSVNKDTRIRVNHLIPVTKGSVLTYYLNSQRMYIYQVAEEGATTATATSGWLLPGSGTYTATADGYFAIALADGTDNTAAINPQDFDSQISIILAEPEAEEESNPLVYEFGGEGNDWCFVYLPDDYDENRAEKYPFIIANHGNGWEMNGSKQYANWTKRTMYVSKTDADYLSAPAQYNGTDDTSLWYSNPTIEALLDAGYIVAGCQNYGDNLYGNDNCRDACVAFYNHMVATYNVEDGCYMIGASNGAMTTLNASYILGDKVKAIILQYPLTCLKNHYFECEDHQASICEAYGITEEVTEENFLELIGGAEFDPLYANVENGVKTGYFPATKIYYSTTDTLTKADYNALPLYNLLKDSGVTVEKVQVDSDGVHRGHGDYAHFAPDEYVEWFSNN